VGNVGSSKEKRIWVIKEKKIKAKRNKKRRTNKFIVLAGDPL